MNTEKYIIVAALEGILLVLVDAGEFDAAKLLLTLNSDSNDGDELSVPCKFIYADIIMSSYMLDLIEPTADHASLMLKCLDKKSKDLVDTVFLEGIESKDYKDCNYKTLDATTLEDALRESKEKAVLLSDAHWGERESEDE